MAGEFDFIARYAPAGAQRPDVILGSGDDAALLQVPPDKALVATVDTLVNGRHFPEETKAYDVGWKALAVNLSDLAAMGAEPAWATIALTLPAMADSESWMADFCAGVQALAAREQVAVVGGDLTAGPLAVTIQALGHVTAGKALRRDAARVGDLIAVTGCLGDARLALHLLQQQTAEPPAELLRRLNRPEPRLAAGQAMAGVAHAAIDISDGLVADLGHILAASGVGASIHAAAVPRSDAFFTHCPSGQVDRWAISGGDDYELCACFAENDLKQLQEAVPDFTVIGRVEEQPGCRILDAQGRRMDIGTAGFDHFAEEEIKGEEQ